jgi:hypothetical protein
MEFSDRSHHILLNNDSPGSAGLRAGDFRQFTIVIFLAGEFRDTPDKVPEDD